LKARFAKALPAHLLALVPPAGFPHTTLLVVGDLMIDKYIVGDVHRISPEAPVPVVSVHHKRSTAGGAGNVALNVSGLRANVVLAGVIGDDSNGRTLMGVLARNNVDTSATIIDVSRPTTSKTRIMSGGYQLVRVDEETSCEISPELVARLKAMILFWLNKSIRGVLLSDYAKGVLNRDLLAFVIDECLKRSIPVFVDPKSRDYTRYAKATCLTPNLKEFYAAARAMGIQHEDVTTAGTLLRERLGCLMLLITQGPDGMTLITADHVRHFPALAEDVFDVSGAGDTVVATFATAFAAGIHPLAAVELSNIAASIVVRKVGTAPITWDELSSNTGGNRTIPNAGGNLAYRGIIGLNANRT
jgi:D-beta-D-heptose 7-phosphate kinase / D-beta-D-heptose 1-phosphate adenosyltransferase